MMCSWASRSLWFYRLEESHWNLKAYAARSLPVVALRWSGHRPPDSWTNLSEPIIRAGQMYQRPVEEPP